MNLRITALTLTAALIAPTALTAQMTQHASLTTWSHSGGSPAWTDNVTMPTTLPAADFKTVDQLNSTTVLSYTGQISGLKAGWYVVAARIMKFKDEKGAADLSIEAIAANGVTKRFLPAAHSLGPQNATTKVYARINKWVWTPAVTFQVKASSGSAIIRIQNADTKITKQNYYFDSFRIGKIPEGKALIYESLTLNTFRSTWAGTYHTRMNPQPLSAFGVDNKLVGVWWLAFGRFGEADKIVLQPGNYSFNFKMLVSSGTKSDLFYRINIGGAGWVKRTWLATDQPTGKWALTPNYSFQVTAKDTEVKFNLENTSSAYKSGYEFDAFILRKGAYDSEGTACSSSLGKVTMNGNIPQLAEPFTMEVANCPTAAIFFFGAQSTKIDLTPAGMPGCTLYTLPILSLAAVAQNNVATLTFPVSNQTSLLGATWINQALVLDTKANKPGLVTSNAMKALIAN
ncbi:MAG: hypothetical protein DRI90_20640 [Deltaproteobacteria bacterium]|nr:MAG: hypothetical protein DRI90_20640 [Deltaproteobacteria bacterium]